MDLIKGLLTEVGKGYWESTGRLQHPTAINRYGGGQEVLPLLA